MVNKKKSTTQTTINPTIEKEAQKSPSENSLPNMVSPLKYTSAVVIVQDLEKSKHFYSQVLQLPIEADFGPNVTFKGGVSIWEKTHACQILGLKESQLTESGPSLLQRMEFYFETEALESWVQRMEQAKVVFVHHMITQPWQQRVFRIKDPDGNIIEIGEPLPCVVQRLAKKGKNATQISAMTSIPEPGVMAMLAFASPPPVNESFIPSKQMLDYYTLQGGNTDPHKEIVQFRDLPSSPAGVPAICKIIQENLSHFFLVALFGQNLYGYTLAEARKKGREPKEETSTESIEQLLRDQKALVLKGSAKKEADYTFQSRPLDTRHFTICRTYAALLVSILRSKGIAARVRCGFARYLNPGLYEDHYVCEYYHPIEHRWILVDAQLDEKVITFMHISFNPYDVPRDMFLVAGDAWMQYKAGKIQADKCGILNIRSAEFIRGNILTDFASLNKNEVQPWANWGLKLKRDTELSKADWDLIDRMAQLTQGQIGDKEFSLILDIYQKTPIIRVPDGFKSPHFNATGVVF